MNINKINQITKSIFLYDIISKQIFKALRNKNINVRDELGSFITSERLGSCYWSFIGSQNDSRTKAIQFIKKKGMLFDIYKIDFTNKTASDSIAYSNLQLNQLSSKLSDIQGFIGANSGNNGLQKSVKYLYQQTTKFYDQIVKGRNGNNKNKSFQSVFQTYFSTLNSRYKLIEDYSVKLNQILLDNEIIENVNNIKNGLENLNSQVVNLNYTIDQIELFQLLDPINKACQNLQTYFILHQSDFKQIGTNASRMNMLNEIYIRVTTQSTDQSVSESVRQFAKIVKNAIQNHDTNITMQRQNFDLTWKNLQDYYEIFDRSYIKYQNGMRVVDNKKQYELQNSQRVHLNSLKLFLQGSMATISYKTFDNALTNLMLKQSDIQDENYVSLIDDDLYNKLQDLLDLIQQLKSQIDNKNSNYMLKSEIDKETNEIKTLHYSDLIQLNSQLMNSIKEILKK